ncbi:helicase-exonuclease AddAB subunit AddA [Roseburia sp. AF12-17LB]|uniref:helicase-exonuclease AddAB subunit AddA n=1 Tax=Roseburia sp. AF12-17LB TaxID=2293127 RepID=UPI000E4BFAA9|nr:helicase-exonuclease AddAB subunit AddA [Roseburia sp. AF12-17LB]RHS23977.1 helicase-exonuclease AddAB subunit AddA [Roseburia sp. AF12-17LB]
MGMTWTKEQQQVIDLRNRNILVSAAAGSGKTAVLVERIKELVLDKKHPVDIDHLLVVTFTNAAAAQMKERVAKALEKALQENPSDVRLQQQAALVQNAQITTIDSFCLYVLRNHFHEIGLEPNFRIGDEGELKLLREDVMTGLFEQCYEGKHPGFLHLISCYGTSRSDAPVRDMIFKLYSYAQSYPWPKQWLREALSCYEIKTEQELEQAPFIEMTVEYGKQMVKGYLEQAEHYHELCQDADGPYMYEDACEQDAKLMEELLSCDTYQAFYEELGKCKFATLGRAKDYIGSPEKQEQVKTERKKLKDGIGKLKSDCFALTFQEILEQLTLVHPSAEALAEVTERFIDAFTERKQDKNLVDFSDLEHFALEILVEEETGKPTETAKEFQNAYEEIMIDEYQDSNYVQETILRAISREAVGQNNLFMVGDVKQSIYRFRLARPELFMEKFDTYETTDAPCQRIDLHKNFRSRDTVLTFTNDIFYQIMKRNLGGVDYTDEAALYCGADYPAGEKEDAFDSEILLTTTQELEEGTKQRISKQELEAKLIADRIRKMVGKEEVVDEETGEFRKVRYGDIVILLRSLSEWADLFAEVLNANGIPAHTVSRTGYFSTLEIRTVLNYLRILDNPRQDIPLAAVLKSPMAGLSDEQLARLRLLAEDKPYHQCVKMFLEAEEELTEKESTADEDMRAKLKRFSETYKKLRRQTMDIPMHELLQKVLKETGYARYASALPAGRQRLANLHMLSEKAIAYEKTSYRGLYHFIRYIDELQKYDVDFGEAELVGENEDAVNIMSIHKSKGLEFPVCFVSGMGKSFNKQDSRSKMILHPNLGVGLDIIEEDRRIKVPAFFKKVIARQTELESLGEELRVLYVAFTRAKEKLIITGYIKDEEMLQQIREIYCGSNRKALNFKERAEAKTFLEWILPSAAASGNWDKVSYVTPWSMLEDEAAHQITEHVSLRQRVQQAKEVSDTLYEKIKEQLSYQYPHPDAIHLVTKYSVSELKHRAMRELAAKEEEDVTPKFLEEVSTPYVPAFMEGKAEVNQGALRGTAMHRLMECYDFTKMPDRSDEFAENIKKQLTGLVQMGKVSEDMQKLIRIPSVELFLKSQLAPRMKAAAMRDDLFREKPFVMGNHEMEEEMVLIQGIIDVFWVEEDGIVLLDYKTDRVDSATRLRDMYKEQLDLYAEALERIFPLPVKEKYLYSFRLNQAIEV